MIDLKAIAKDAAERVHQNGGCVPQMAFAPILFALEDALSTTPARAEGQEGEVADEEDDDDDPHSPCSVCGDEYPDGVLEDGRCPSCCDKEED